MDVQGVRIFAVTSFLFVISLLSIGISEAETPIEPAGPPPSTMTKAKPFAVQGAGPTQAYPGRTFRLRYTIYLLNDTHYLYKNAGRLTLEKVEGVDFSPVRYWPKPTQKLDPYESKVVEVYHVPVTLYVEGTVAEDARIGTRQVEARVAYRGCNASVCFFPAKETIRLTLEIVPEPAGATQKSGP